MTRTTNAGTPAPAAMHPSYKLCVLMPATQARPFIRKLFHLIQHFIVVTELRGSTNKSGYRLQHGSSVCDFVYGYNASQGSFVLQTQFKPGASNELAGRVLALLGLILSYHERTGTPLKVNRENSKMPDIKTLTKWGDWAVSELAKKYPAEFPELAPPQEVKF